MSVYLRHQGKCGQRTFAPLESNHPLIKGFEVCPACLSPFKEGDVLVLIPVGPGLDEEDREKAKNGRWYNAVAIAVHAACAGWDMQ